MKQTNSRVLAPIVALLPVVVLLIMLSTSVAPNSNVWAKPFPLASPTLLGGRILVQVIANTAVFRTGPGRAFPVVSSVKRSNKIELSGISRDRAWYMFIYASKLTWISADETITQLIQGDVSLLPVIAGPPIPTPRPTSNAQPVPYDPIACTFDNNMSDEAQDALVKQMNDAMTANDWRRTGVVARRLYICTMNGVFYVLYTQDVQTKLAQGLKALDEPTAYVAFVQGWRGQ